MRPHWGLAQGLGRARSDAFQAGVYGKNYWGPDFRGAKSRSWPVTVAQPDGIRVRYRVNTGRAHSWLARPSLTRNVTSPP